VVFVPERKDFVRYVFRKYHCGHKGPKTVEMCLWYKKEHGNSRWNCTAVTVYQWFINGGRRTTWGTLE
jgi:hypothetical protein